MVDPVTATALATVGSSLIGGAFGRKAAKDQNAANERINRMQMMPYLDAQPYTTGLYSQGQDALQAALDRGAYTGQTYAGMTDQEKDAAGLGETSARNAYADSLGFMGAGRGFASNYGNLYNQAQQDMLGNAIGYASNNVQSLLKAAMQDDYRNFYENQLPGTGLAASASGNTNSSRRGVREAILERGLQDRQAKTATNLQDMLIGRSLNAQQNQFSNAMEANRNLANAYNTGFANTGTAADRLATSGGMLRTDQQAQLDDARARFENKRDFAMNQLVNYNAGILGRTPTSFGQLSNNYASPTGAGLSGAMMGFGFGQKYGGNIANMFGQPQQQPMGYGTTGATGMSKFMPYTDNMGFGVG